MRWALGGFLSVCGTLMLALAIYLLVQGKASESWPSTSGAMQKSDVTSRHSTGSGSRASSTTYLPDLEYTFEVDGKSYTGTRLELAERGMGEQSQIAGRLTPFPVGARVTVFYDPDDPSNCVLLRGAPSAVGIPFAMGIIMLLAGVLAIVMMAPDRGPERRRRRRERRANGE